MDIGKEKWSTQMLQVFQLNTVVLPKILPNCAEFGTITNDRVPHFKGVQIKGSAGDQQAACIGQNILEPYATKLTLGTGGFVLTNTGTKRVRSSGGLLCTPCYKLGEDVDTIFAIEGSIAIVGAGVSWLQKMGMIKDPKEISEILKECPESGGVVFVPAFSGLFAPRWRADARACIMGMTQQTGRGHIIRAFCESVGMQLTEILTSLARDMGINKVPYICVDGGMSKNFEVMQLISNIVDTTLEMPAFLEATCAGAAILAGFKAGIWDSIDSVKNITGKRLKTWNPDMTKEKREEIVKYWNLGVERSLLWNQ